AALPICPNRLPPHCWLLYLRHHPKVGRQTDPVRLTTAHIPHRSVADSTQKHHLAVHHVSSVAKKPQSQNKSELFILSHPGTCTECLTSTTNYPRYNRTRTQFAIPCSGRRTSCLIHPPALAALAASALFLTACGLLPNTDTSPNSITDAADDTFGSP